MHNAKWLRALCALFLMTSSMILAGCNTMAGAGKDIGAAGGKMEEEAKEHKSY